MTRKPVRNRTEDALGARFLESDAEAADAAEKIDKTERSRDVRLYVFPQA